MELQGRTIVVTGAGGSIGVQYVQALAEAGANVVATDLPQGLAACRDALGAPPTVAFVEGDITSDEDWAQVTRVAVDQFGSVDGLVNNAAIYQALEHKRELIDLTTDQWDQVLRVNVRGVWQGIRAVVPHMREGSVVNISSAVARAGGLGFAHYVASKSAVEGLTRAAAQELGRYSIRVNAVSPGLVDNAATRTLNQDAAYLDRAMASRSVPRALMPQDLVGAVLFLLSDQSAFITGQTLIVDGGGVFV